MGRAHERSLCFPCVCPAVISTVAQRWCAFCGARALFATAEGPERLSRLACVASLITDIGRDSEVDIEQGELDSVIRVRPSPSALRWLSARNC